MRLITTGLVAVLMTVAAGSAWAHCQIPCGIYGDEMRFQMIEEHLATIEKSMAQIQDESLPVNQTVRWVTNKERHCQELQDIITAYFLAQRIKPVADGEARDDYLVSLEYLHRMHVEAMKAKQTTDPAHVEALRELAANFHKHYFKDKEHDHE